MEYWTVRNKDGKYYARGGSLKYITYTEIAEMVILFDDYKSALCIAGYGDAIVKVEISEVEFSEEDEVNKLEREES